MEQVDNQPFGLLPEDLAEELLGHCGIVGEELTKNLKEVRANKIKYRDALLKLSLLKKSIDLTSCKDIQTTCAVDGAYVVEKLMATDLVACAAMAIEGLIPPSEKTYWSKPHHIKPFIEGIKHNSQTTRLTQGLVWMMQITLAANSPHDIIFIDGSIINPFMKVNSAMAELKENEELKKTRLGKELVERFEVFLDSYFLILSNTRTDKLWVGIPKHTSLNELGEKNELNWPKYYDDETMLSSIMEADEYIEPISHKTASTESWHISTDVFSESKEVFERLENKVNQCVRAIQKLKITYYKPRKFLPAMRIEIPAYLSSNGNLLKMLFAGIEFQTQTPGILAPFPLYMAARMVNNLSSAIPAFRQTVTNAMALETEGDLSDILINMKSYKTESGK
jgi:hypothetical protein